VDTTILIKAHDRPACLQRLVSSLAQHAPEYPVYIHDDGRAPSYAQDPPENVALYHYSPDDIGLSAGRNFLLDHCPTEFFVTMDDDFVMLPETDLGALVQWVRSGLYDLAGGALRFQGRVYHYEGFLELEGGTLKCSSRSQDIVPQRCDVVLNFFAARTDLVRHLRWDPQFEMGEHLDFFLRAMGYVPGGPLGKRVLRVGYVPHVAADHRPEDTSGGYKAAREEKADRCRRRFQAKWGITSIRGQLQ